MVYAARGPATPTAAEPALSAPAHDSLTARRTSASSLSALCASWLRVQPCVIALRRAEGISEPVAADGGGSCGGGGGQRLPARTGVVSGLEYREHRPGAAGCAGAGEAWEESGGPARSFRDPMLFGAATLGFIQLCPSSVSALSCPFPPPFHFISFSSAGRPSLRPNVRTPRTGGSGVFAAYPSASSLPRLSPPLCCVPLASRFFALQVSSRTSGAVPPKEEELRAAVEVLRGHGLHSVLEEWFVEVLQNDLQANISPEFWNAISQCENSTDEPQCLLLLLDAFGLLESRLDPYLRSLELLEKWTRLGLLMGTGAQGLREKVHTMLRGVLFFSTPRTFQEMIQRLYGCFLRVYMQSKRKGEGGTDPELEGELDSRYARRRYYRLLQSPLCAGCSSDKQQCWCRQALEQFHQLSQVL